MLSNSIRVASFCLLVSWGFSACRTTPSPQQSAPKEGLAAYFHYQEGRKPLISAHRGGKGLAGYPENCLETMQYVYQNIDDAIFEVDVAQTKDGV
ncbi:MAG: glycerophosphodiester phosphodiesterase, partial [Bacteroidota bacterium]